MVQKRLKVPYRGQKGIRFCGPACAQMVIESLGGRKKSQPTWYQRITTNWQLDRGSPWFSSPDGLRTSLNRAAGIVPSGPFDVVSFQTEPTLTRWLLWSVARGVPALALVTGWTHWVVIYGYEASRHPVEAGDTGYDIESLYLHNPSNMRRDLKVSFTDWQLQYLWKVPSGLWHGRLVGVGVFGASDGVFPAPVAPLSPKE